MTTEITISYLELTSPEDFRVSESETPPLDIRECELASPEFSRFLYTAVGGDLYWVDRLGWSHARWRDYLERPQLRTWVAYHRGTPVGYLELDAEDTDVEIALFGLLPAFRGMGFGGRLLSFAVEQAWAMGAARIWLHTCSLDGEAALPNYRKRGFRVFKTETEDRELAPEPPGPWPGAHEAE